MGRITKMRYPNGIVVYYANSEGFFFVSNDNFSNLVILKGAILCMLDLILMSVRVRG